MPSVFWVLWAGTLVNRAATFVAPFLMLYLVRERGIDPVAAGALLSVQGVALAVSNLVGGRLADLSGRRSTMVVGLVSTAAIVFLLPEVSNVAALGVLVTLLGLAADLHRPALNAFVADVVPEADRVRAYGLLHWAINLGMSVAMVGGGLIASVGYDWLFRFDAVATVVFGVVVWVLVPGRRENVAAEADVPTGRVPWRDRRLLVFVLMSFLIFTVYFQSYATLPLAITDAGLSTRDFGTVLGVNGVIVAVLQPLLAGRLNRVGEPVALAASYVLVGIGFGLTAVASGLLGFGGAVALWTVGEIGLMAVGTAYAAGLAMPGYRGRYLGVHGAAVAAAVAAAPLIGTTLYEISGALLWGTCAAVGLLLGVMQLRMGDAAPRPAPRKEHELA